MKILIDESVLRQALEAMNKATDIADKHLKWDRRVDDDLDFIDEAANALRTALDAAEKVEPVTFNEWWMDQDFDPVEGFPAALAAWEFRNTHPAPAVPEETK